MSERKAAARRAYEQANEEAQRAWKTFDAERGKMLKTGQITSTALLDPEDPTMDKLHAMHADYDQAAERAEKARTLYMATLDDLTTGHAKHGNATQFGQLEGIAAAFRENGGTKALDGTTGGTAVPSFWDDRIFTMPSRSLFTRSLIPTVRVDGDKVDYIRQTTRTNNAAPVAPGALKPTSVVSIERVTTPIRVIAHLTEAIDRSLIEDFQGLSQLLDSELRLGILLAEENQLINGSGSGVNLRGILNTSGIIVQAKGVDSTADAIFKALTQVRLSLLEPDGIVLHPTDWQGIRLGKTADGDYTSAPIVEADPDRLWGKTVIKSPVIAQGTALVGAFGQGCTVYDREDTRVTFAETGLGDNAGEELFSRNQLRWRAEERIGFAVHRPTAFCTVTGL